MTLNVTVPPQTLSMPRRGEDNFNWTILVWSVLAGSPSIYDLSREAAGIGLIALVALPVLAVWISRRTLFVADPIIVIGLMWVLAAALPAVAPDLYNDAIWQSISDQAWDAATLWMYRAWAACSIIYWFIRSLPQRWPRTPATLFYAHTSRLRVGIGVLGLCACIAHIVMTRGQAYSHIDGFAATSTLDQIVQELRQLSKIYVFLYCVASGRGRLVSNEKWLLYGILGVYVVIFSASASKGVVIELIAMWVLGRGEGAHRPALRKDLALGIAALVMTYLVFIWVTAYRAELAESATQPAASFSEAMDLQLDAAEVAFKAVATGQTIGSIDNPYGANSILDRLGYVSSFAKLLDRTGGVSPYENAYQSFLTPLYAILPRNVFEGKSQFFDSGDFAQMLGWNFGGFSVTLPASLFWAWGFQGVILGMTMLGLCTAHLARLALFDDNRGFFARVLLGGLVLSLMNVGLHFQPIIISLVRMAAILLALNMIVRLLFRVRKTAQRSKVMRP
jgi:hypothetical protein